MNYIHNKKGQFSKNQANNHYYKLPWHIALIVLAAIVLVIVTAGTRARAQSFEPLTLPVKVAQPKRAILTPEEEAQVRAKQDLILKEAEALKIKKGLESELAKVEAELAANRKQSLSFR